MLTAEAIDELSLRSGRYLKVIVDVWVMASTDGGDGRQ
jgi:hypothetical protein